MKLPRFITTHVASVGAIVLVVGAGTTTYAIVRQWHPPTVPTETTAPAKDSKAHPAQKKVPVVAAPAPAAATPQPSTPVAKKTAPASTAPVSPTPPPTPPPAAVTPAPSSPASGLAPTGSTTPPSGGGTQSSTSYRARNWAGYVALNATYTSVSGQWTVPHSTATTQTTYSTDAAWVGIGGVSPHADLIQAGTVDIVSPDGTIQVEAFYELLPSSAQYVSALTVSPGDTVSAVITQVSGSTWAITITDATTGQSYNTSVNYTSSLSSAEWIEEDPTGADGQLMPLGNFGTVPFSGTQTTANGAVMGAGSASASSITMVDSSGNIIAAPSSLQGDSFNVSYQ